LSGVIIMHISKRCLKLRHTAERNEMLAAISITIRRLTVSTNRLELPRNGYNRTKLRIYWSNVWNLIRVVSVNDVAKALKYIYEISSSTDRK